MRNIEYTISARQGLRQLRAYLEQHFAESVVDGAIQETELKILRLANDPLLGLEHNRKHNIWTYLAHPNTRLYYQFSDKHLRVLLVWGTRQSNARLRKALREATSQQRPQL